MIEPKADRLTVFNKSFTIENPSADNLVKLTFKEQPTAHTFFDELVQLLPLIDTEYPQIHDKAILLTQEQYFFYQRCAIAETGNLTTAYLGDSFLKTLRTDEFDFSHAFILGIIPGEQNTRRLQNLRPRSRQSFTITPEGKITARHEKQPMYTAKEKEGFSQIQSCTLIDEKTLSAAFGFFKERKPKLFGLMTHIDDTLISRLLINDSGTVVRIFDFSSTVEANSSASYNNYTNGLIFHPTLIDSFKAKNLSTRKTNFGTNEVLARMRFNPYRSVVSICSDTLEARLLACDFAQELLHHFAVYAESQGMRLNPHFKLPIIFYLPTYRLGHELKFYTPTMLKNDRNDAAEIYHNENRRQQYYRNQDYEFLLGLDVITSEILLERINGVPLALDMMRNGKVRMLMRLLRTSAQHSLSDRVFNSLLTEGMITKNDPIIAKLIMAEAFNIADKFIAATTSVKTELKFEGELLIDHIISCGNPRHLHYMSLNQMLIHAAKKRSWISITLCLKEYRHIDKTFPGEIFSEAVKSNNWTPVESLTRHYPKSDDTGSYGYALLEAVRDQQVKLANSFLQAGAKATWRNQQTDLNYQLLSALYYAVYFNLNELLPDLIAHEQECQDDYYQARLWLALDLAYCRGNNEAIALLQKICGPVSVDPENIQACICKLILEALIVKDSEIAELRLLRYCRQYKLFSEDNPNVLDGLEIIKDYLVVALQSYKSAKVYKDALVTLTELITQEQRRSDRYKVRIELSDIQFSARGSKPLTQALLWQRYREADLLFKLTMTAEDVQRELHESVQSEEWDIVELFTRYPTDAEDTQGYGYALLKALQHQQLRLAKLLLQAGAKATWRKWKTEDDPRLESTLLYAVAHDYNELLPKLIALENSNQDDCSPARLNLALDLAYVRSNREAISILEHYSGSATVIDPSDVIKSICIQVLEAFSAGQRQVGELRLLRYCHHYDLLPKENRRIIDGLAIIKNILLSTLHLYTVNEAIRALNILIEIIMSDLEPELLRLALNFNYDHLNNAQHQVRKKIYSTIVKYLSNDNLDTVNTIIQSHELGKDYSRCSWREVLATSPRRYSHSHQHSHTSDPVAILQYKSGIIQSSYDYFIAFEYAMTSGNQELSMTLLNHPLAGEAVKERSLTIAIEKGSGPHILFLIKNNQFNVTTALLLTAIKHDMFLVLLSLLKASETKKASNKTGHGIPPTTSAYNSIKNHTWTLLPPPGFTSLKQHHWNLYSIWAYASLTDDKRRASCKLLTRALGPARVKHFTLINLLVVLSSKYIDPESKSILLNLDRVLVNVSSAILSFATFSKKHKLGYHVKDSDTHQEILTLLNGYFSRIDTLPEEAIIASTYKKMREYFTALYNNSFPNRFFKIRPLSQRDYNTEIYNTLRDVELALKQPDGPDEQPVNESFDDMMVSIVHSKT